MNRHRIIATAAKPQKISIGRGIASSAMIGPVACENLPKRLQMPKAVPHNVIGKTQGVESWQVHMHIEAPNLAMSTKVATSKLFVANLFWKMRHAPPAIEIPYPIRKVTLIPTF